MTTRDECIQALREAAQRLASSPTKAEYEELELTPASATIIRVMGGWNDAKEAAGLDTNPSTGSRVGPPPDGVPDEIRERWSELSVDQRWHYRNVSKNAERTLARRSHLREWVSETKAASGCVECDESNPACLDFHHRDPESKTMKLSKMVTDGFSKSRLREEMAKCEVICANCHREKHTDETGIEYCAEQVDDPSCLLMGAPADLDLSSRQRKQAWVHIYKRRRGCVCCGYGNAASLDLHHIDTSTKSKSVSQLISDGCTFDRLLSEVEKCEVLCANCHRKEHRD